MATCLPVQRHPIAACVAAAFALTAATRLCHAANDIVTSCSDSGPGSLRDTIAGAAEGDTVVLNPTALQCSSITLSGGEILVRQDNLTVKYDGDNANRFTIAGSNQRVFHHIGSGTLTLQRLDVELGKYTGLPGAVAAGGCIYSPSGTVDLEYSSVGACSVTSGSTGTSQGSGGGAVTAYILLVNHSTITGSSVSDPTAAFGGGASAAYASVSYSSITGNMSSGVGGGLSATSMRVSNSTISGNKAAGGGGALATANVFYIENSTIAFNQSDGSAVIAVHYESLSPFGTPHHAVIQSSILSNNVNTGAAPGYDVRTYGRIYQYGGFTYDMVVMGSNDIVMSASSQVFLPVDTRRQDPLLLPLADNGGGTLTHAFGDASPAYRNGANPGKTTNDQRGDGFARAIDGVVDIGAYEEQTRDVVYASGFE